MELLGFARKEVAILTSDIMHGRGYVDGGHLVAAEYLEKRFKEIGLEALSQTGYQQKFPIQLNFISRASLSINGTALEAGKEFIVHRLSGRGNGNFKVKDLGYGLKNKNGMQGKALLFREGLPDKIRNNPRKQAKYEGRKLVAERIQAIRAFQPGAILVIKDKLTTAYAPEQIGVPVFEIKPEALPKMVKKVQASVDAGLSRFQSQNVIGILPGTSKADSAIIISAHYDHLGKLGEAIFPGANDNASGVAMILSLATYFKENPLEYSLIFIAFGGEETGLNGSYYYTEVNPLFELSKTKFVLNLDLMGNGDEGIVAVGGKDFPQYFELLSLANQEQQAVPIVRSRVNAPNSDHYFFLEKGIPGFFVYTLGGPPYYHDVNDTAENLPLSKFVEVRGLLINFLKDIGT